MVPNNSYGGGWLGLLPARIPDHHKDPNGHLNPSQAGHVLLLVHGR
jgi:hypothetical protein